MALGVLGYSPPRREATFPRHTAMVTVAAAVISSRYGAIAADSLHIELETGAGSMVAKVIRLGDRLGALAGISDVDGFDFTHALQLAFQRATRIDDVAEEFLHVAAAHLPRAYDRLHTVTGLTPTEFPTELLVVDAADGIVELANFWSRHDGVTFTMHGNVHVASQDHTICEAVGAHEPIVTCTEQARIQPHLRHQAHRLGPLRDAVDAGQLASDLVATVLAKEPDLRRPSQWPAGLPVVAGPVQAVSISALPG
jgi:hypothetical protein